VKSYAGQYLPQRHAKPSFSDVDVCIESYDRLTVEFDPKAAPGREMLIGNCGFAVFPEKWEFEPKPLDRTASMKMKSVNDALYDHIANFLACVKVRQRAVCDIEVGQRSSNTCFLANIAYRSKERLMWDAAKQHLTQGSPQAQELRAREYRAPWTLTV